MTSVDWCAGRTMNRREAIESAIRIMAPRIPRHEREAITDHALVSRGLRTALPEIGRMAVAGCFHPPPADRLRRPPR